MQVVDKEVDEIIEMVDEVDFVKEHEVDYTNKINFVTT